MLRQDWILTKHEMEIQIHASVFNEGEIQYSLLRLAAMVAQLHTPVRDALDKLVLGCNTNLQGVDSVIKSTEGACIDKGKGGQKYKTSKGASHHMCC